MNDLTFRNPIAGTEHCPIAGRDPHGPHWALFIIQHYQSPDGLTGSAIHRKPVIHTVETDLIAARLLFRGPKSRVRIQV